ncbi:MAG: 7-cyano-7-deazaguanine synthase QueC [Pseudomonadota bacterium]
MSTIIKGAVILCSGGIDSTTVMALAKDAGFALYSLSFSYGQRHSIELKAAQRVSSFFNVKKHLILDLNLDKIGGSALTDTLEVPKGRSRGEISKEIPLTYVPARNTIFLSYALAWAEVLKISDIFIGANAIDYSGYPDCRPEFLQAFETLAALATKAGVEGKLKLRIRAPLLHMTKAEIIKKGINLGVDYSITHSCYDPLSDGKACGRCDSCMLRLKGFIDAGLTDPARYV